VVVVKSLPGTRESGGSGIVQHQPFEILYLVRNLGAAAAHDVAVRHKLRLEALELRLQREHFLLDQLLLARFSAASASGNRPAPR
jgi:hypothetical protein